MAEFTDRYVARGRCPADDLLGADRAQHEGRSGDRSGTRSDGRSEARSDGRSTGRFDGKDISS